MQKTVLLPNELGIVQNIMANYSHTSIFGLRAKDTHKKFSDLDLCIKDSINLYDYELLKEVFEHSNLPFRVDLVAMNHSKKLSTMTELYFLREAYNAHKTHKIFFVHSDFMYFCQRCSKYT